MPIDVPEHISSRRRDGRREVMLHRSMAVIGDEKIEIKAARSTVWLPLIGLALSGAAIWWIGTNQGAAPIWALVLLLLFLLFAVPVSAMSLVSSIAGADVVVDRRKNSATWQQGYLGMGIGTKDLVPFEKIDYLEVTVEGEDTDRWREEQDSLRQFALTLVKKSGKRLKLAQVPVVADDQAFGMDRTLAVGNAIAQLTGTEVRLPEGWQLVEIDTQTLEPVAKAGAAPKKPRRRR